MSAPVRTGSPDIQPASGSLDVLGEVRNRLDDKDAEIAFLREQLDKAQAEVERRATSTDEALKTIDRVVRSFEMQAEANKALALSSTSNPTQAAGEPVRFSEEWDTQPDVMLTAKAVQPDHTYQPPEVGLDRV